MSVVWRKSSIRIIVLCHLGDSAEKDHCVMFNYGIHLPKSFSSQLCPILLQQTLGPLRLDRLACNSPNTRTVQFTPFKYDYVLLT